MSSQAVDFSSVAAGAYQEGPALNVDAGKTAAWSLVGDLDAECEVYLEKSLDLYHWDVLETFAAGSLNESGTVDGKGHFRFRLQSLDYTAQDEALDGVIEDVRDVGDALSTAATAVATTAATSTVPFGYAEAQANAIVAAVNALVVRQGEIEAELRAKGWIA